MKLKTESADLFFVVCTRQLMSGLIDSQTYRARLECLLKMMKKNTKLFNLVQLIMDKEGDMTPESVNNSIKEGSCSELIKAFHNDQNCLNYTGEIRIADPDPIPSKPHLHVSDKKAHCNKKINIYTGESTDGASYSLNELINLWNDTAFIGKIKKNIDTICAKQQSNTGH